MLARLRPGQRRIVLRAAGFADVDDHVPHRRRFDDNATRDGAQGALQGCQTSCHNAARETSTSPIARICSCAAALENIAWLKELDGVPVAEAARLVE
jgi:hypothetical protein